MGLVALQHVESSEPGIEPMSLALPGRFFTSEPPGKPKMGQYFDRLTVTDRPQ